VTYEVSGFPCTEQRFASQRFYYTHDPKSLVYILNVDEKPDVEVVEAEIFLSYFLIVRMEERKISVLWEASVSRAVFGQRRDYKIVRGAGLFDLQSSQGYLTLVTFVVCLTLSAFSTRIQCMNAAKEMDDMLLHICKRLSLNRERALLKPSSYIDAHGPSLLSLQVLEDHRSHGQYKSGLTIQELAAVPILLLFCPTSSC